VDKEGKGDLSRHGHVETGVHNDLVGQRSWNRDPAGLGMGVAWKIGLVGTNGGTRLSSKKTGGGVGWYASNWDRGETG